MTKSFLMVALAATVMANVAFIVPAVQAQTVNTTTEAAQPETTKVTQAQYDAAKAEIEALKADLVQFESASLSQSVLADLIAKYGSLDALKELIASKEAQFALMEVDTTLADNDVNDVEPAAGPNNNGQTFGANTIDGAVVVENPNQVSGNQ